MSRPALLSSLLQRLTRPAPRPEGPIRRRPRTVKEAARVVTLAGGLPWAPGSTSRSEAALQADAAEAAARAVADLLAQLQRVDVRPDDGTGERAKTLRDEAARRAKVAVERALRSEQAAATGDANHTARARAAANFAVATAREAARVTARLQRAA